MRKIRQKKKGTGSYSAQKKRYYSNKFGRRAKNREKRKRKIWTITVQRGGGGNTNQCLGVDGMRTQGRAGCGRVVDRVIFRSEKRESGRGEIFKIIETVTGRYEK